MDNLDDSENNAKISDSAYSNSCSNSQSRRSHSSKSTHSGSHSSGSSGYCGKPSTSGSSNNLLPPKKDKEPKKKKLQPQIETLVPDVVVEEVRAPEPLPTFEAPKEEKLDVDPTLPPVHAQTENGVENMVVCTPELTTLKDEVNPAANFPLGRPLQTSYCNDGFSCVISMHDGVVMYATSTLTTTLGFPKDMWIGRSFIDFVHPRDRSTFASQITNGLAVPKIVNGTPEKVKSPANSVSTMVCRIRRYRGLTTGFGVKERVLAFMPFLLKLTFKNISDEEGKVIYLVIQATPFYSAFKTPNEMVTRAVPFVIRHAANGHIEYVDPQSVPYLGYLPQDLADKDVLSLYHPEDLQYLRTVYDTIVKEEGMPKSKPYRMVTQNGDYVRLETEWSSFINPWSKKLEFVIGKHNILEGPTNPDVFQPSDQKSSKKLSEADENKAKMLKENIIRAMNEGLTKPAEFAKQQMSQRCQNLASFMESLMEETPKLDEELRLEIQDQDHSYYERDSVMLGGISPHHDYYDSQSSTETPLSYTQINYNETLQRYFLSQGPDSFADYDTGSGRNIRGEVKSLVKYTGCLSPIAQHSRDSGEISSSDSNGMNPPSSSPILDEDYQPVRLTEALINKHNAEMEKELTKLHRETRSSSKGDRGKNSSETRKKKEHLARCNASFHPTSAGTTELQPPQPHGLKRPSKMMDAESSAHKHHCTSARQARRNKRTLSISATDNQPTLAIPTAMDQLATASNQWTPATNMNAYILGVGIPQQMSIMSTMPHPMQPMHTMSAVPGMYPMYYAPAAPQPIPTTSHHHLPSNSQQHQFQGPMMVYGHPLMGTPIMYSPMTQQVTYPTLQTQMAMAQSIPQQYTNTMNALGLTSSNFEEESGPQKSRSGNEESTIYSTDIRSSNNLSLKSTDVATNTPPLRESQLNKRNRLANSEGTPDKTDGESSYSSFYSSFFKTESGSAEDSGDGKNGNKPSSVRSLLNATSYHVSQPTKIVTKRKMDPPWLEQVCVTSELFYKYQIHTKSLEETLAADKQRMKSLEQPSLVNEQLSQLYQELQLEGVAARLTLEEGITSSSSSDEDTRTQRTPHKKQQYSRLVMIYEEDAPLPSSSEDASHAPETIAQPSTSKTC